MTPYVQVLTDGESVARAALTQVLQFCHESIRQRGRFTVALAGGSTPKRLYQLLAGERELPFDKVHFFFGDERHVPPDDADSNFRMAKDALFSKVGVPEANVHRMLGELEDAQEAALRYEDELLRFFQPPPGERPRFDVVLLGLGADGHTASLFPGTAAVHEEARWVAAPWVEKLKTHRITLTAPVLNAARAAMFLVQGADKAVAVGEVLQGKAPVDQLPARVVRPEPGGLWWFLDQAAAARLTYG